MPRWQRLYHKHIASFFNRSLYLNGFATFARALGVSFVSWEIAAANVSRLKMAVCTRANTTNVLKTIKGGLSEAWKK